MAVYSFSTRAVVDEEIVRKEKKRHNKYGTNFSTYIIELIKKDISSRGAKND